MKSRTLTSKRHLIDRTLGLSSYEGKKDYFILSREGRIIARTYRLGSQWYVWFEKPCFRQKVENFTEALRVFEEVFLCVA